MFNSHRGKRDAGLRGSALPLEPARPSRPSASNVTSITPDLRRSQRQVDILWQTAPAVGQERLGGLESFGWFRIAAEGALFRPARWRGTSLPTRGPCVSGPGYNAPAPLGDRWGFHFARVSTVAGGDEGAGSPFDCYFVVGNQIPGESCEVRRF